MKKFLSFIRNLSVTKKFMLAYLGILIVPIIFLGVYMGVKTSESAIDQGRLVMEQNILQTRASIVEKVNMVENISTLISLDKNVRSVLGNMYDHEVLRIHDYQFNISPFIMNILRLNDSIYAIRFYTNNTIITEMINSYYSVNKENDSIWFRELENRKPESKGWITSHDAVFHLLRPNDENIEQVFSYNDEIKTINVNRKVGMIEIEIRESMLFDVLRDPVVSELGQVFIINSEGKIVSKNIPEYYNKSIESMGIESYISNSRINEVRKIMDMDTIFISIPIEEINCSIVGMFPVNNFNREVRGALNSIIIVLIIASAIMGIVIYFATNGLLGRVQKLVKAMKQVREGNLAVSVPTHTNDEFGELASTFNHMTSRIHDLVETVYKIKLMEKETELKILENQINPHFLYNTLATISWVARKDGSPKAVKISNSLAKFYRLVLNKGNTLISVEEEMVMLKSYIDIQKIRFEDMFDVIYDIDSSIYECSIIKHILQPIVENALVHGIEPKRSHGSIKITAKAIEDKLHFCVIDDGVGMDKETLKKIYSCQIERTKGSGYALKNIIERLESYYGDKCSINIYSRKGIGTTVTLIIPRTS